MLAECPIGKDTGGAYFDQVAAEIAFKAALLESTEIEAVVNSEDIQVSAASVIPVEAYAAIALDATIHLVMNEWAHVLISKGSFLETGPTVYVSCHHGHILEVALAAFVTYRAVMGVVKHEPLND